MNSGAALVVGYPRTGFTLLISVIAEISNCANIVRPNRHALKVFCDTAGMQISEHIEQVFLRRGISNELLYNYNFRQMVGGPKWLKEGRSDTACFRKYIGVKGKGDFTLLTSHPRQVLDYYEITHSHVAPSRWAAHPGYAEHQRFASIRHPAGTLASACFSLNALASEYIQKFVPPEQDNDLLRQKFALYKLSDLNFFEALLSPFKAYLEEFSRCSDQYVTMRWEDLIQNPVDTVLKVADAMGVSIDRQQAVEIWHKLDHVNLTGAHKHNLRYGHGVVNGWKLWLTNTHLDMMRDYGLDVFSQEWGYGSIGTLDEAAYTPFQKQLASAISNHEIIREYDDEDLFGFAFNKSNLDLSRFAFKRYDWRTHTQIERSSCTEDDLVMEVWDAAESACDAINRSLGHWFDIAEATNIPDNPQRIEMMAIDLAPLFCDSSALSAWKNTMFQAISYDDMEQRDEGVSPAPDLLSHKAIEPVLLESIDAMNIINYSGKYYAVPQCLGPIDFHKQNVEAMSGVLVAKNMEDILFTLKKNSI
ncbi:hypothetical protein B0F88_10791 [Methylobacter tundripaludum]|uniref:Sulfotransferase family protein n=1 Tax=Methylobacter tundripaludum TaxID=173365 RepID=A0A2S6H2B5_9GAMM|nr:hypothetical protein [Methylobacter tundripaludum]PPK71567.1 hypothetical protein B0F88_10791 [Methylobacter tundripaludum]